MKKIIQKILIFLIFCFLVLGVLFYSRKYYLNHQPSIISHQSPSPQPSAINHKPLFSFAVIGDPEGDTVNLNKALKLVKENNLSFVVLTGDLTQIGTPEQFQAIKSALDASGLKYYVIPGNHDLWQGRKTCQEQKANCTNTDIFSQYFGNTYYKQVIDQDQFLFLDNADEWLGFGNEQLNWINKQLSVSSIQQPATSHPAFAKASAGRQSLITNHQSLVFVHIPLYHKEAIYMMGTEEPKLKEQAQQVLDQLCNKPPLAIFYGHLHRSSQYEYQCNNGNKLKMIVVGSINSKRNWQLPRFLKVDVLENGELKTEEIIP